MSILIQKFLIKLHDNKIDYVHWKSNTNIDKALVGDDDLDMLVNPKDKSKVYRVFKELKIIRAYSEKDSWQHEIFHYFGLDIEEKRMVHIHLHFLLEVGYDFDKSFNLPIVERYIASKELYKNSIYISSVESEYIILIIRLILKNGVIPFLLTLPTSWWDLYCKKSKIEGSAYREYIDLRGRSSREKIDKLLNSIFNFIDKSLFYELERVVERNDSLISYFLAEIKLRKYLKKYSYNSIAVSFIKSLYRVNLIRLRKLFNSQIKLKKIPANGGRIFAFVGGDGAGKSSNIEKLSSILSKHYFVKKIHIGRPNYRGEKRGYFLGHQIRNIGKILIKIGIRDFGKALNYFGLAIERKEAFKKAKKIKSKGGVVILDRIPLNGITAMDAPRIKREFGDRYRFLAKLEERIYSNFNGVDRVIALKLNPKIALKRRPKDNREELLIRSGQIWEYDFSKIDNTTVIDTENSFKYVEEEILKSIWDSIYSKPRVIELAGLAGTGKSTLKNHLLELYPKAIYGLRGDGVGLFLLKNIYLYLSLYIQGGYGLFKSLIKIDILQNRLKSGFYDSNQYLILDQGPIFYAVNIISRLPKFENIILDKIADIAQYYDEIIFLEAPLDILSNRINSREQKHRVKNLNKSVQIEFLKRHREVFKKVLKLFHSKGVRVYGVDTSSSSPDEVKEIADAIIRKR